ncbi:hypothetical protein PT974_10039 [Cladobotryum mycophilum]|uniref:Uncharacterized protein n=1 Tax=Cladobotryum mycophilum TaxID=491253 RepID=A0ABR0S8R2_9HYPO
MLPSAFLHVDIAICAPSGDWEKAYNVFEACPMLPSGREWA